jgi:Flp pilus assembly protein CpaB
MNIENKKQAATILLAVAFGLAAAYLTGMYVKNSVETQTRKLSEDYKKKNDVVINEMSKMNKNMAQLVKKQKQLEQQQKNMPRQKIVQQAPQEKKVSQTNFSLRTPPGKRAVTILIDSLSAVGGLVGPGDFVDIIGKLQVPDSEESQSRKREIISVLMQGIQVLAVGTNFNPLVGDLQVYQSQQNARALNITLAVDSKEAGLLAFVQSNGNLQLSLRPPREKQTTTVTVASWDTLSDYVLDKQGTELLVPTKTTSLEKLDDKGNDISEVKPFIQIFKSGQQL